MDKKRYHINQPAVLFHSSLDESNGSTTVVANPDTGGGFVVNKLKYFILKIIDENPGINQEFLIEKVKIKIYPEKIEEDINNILNFFIDEQIIYINE